MVVNAASDTAKGNQIVVPMVIGFAVSGCHMMMTPLTGTSINPSRTIGSAIASIGINNCNARVWKHLWVFLTAPLLGGAVATVVYQQLLTSEKGDLEAQYRKAKAPSNKPAPIVARVNVPHKRKQGSEDDEVGLADAAN